ncbi:HEAT repeat domain-containing protein [Elusimicrobiota bacterium]
MKPDYESLYRKAGLLCALGLLASPSFGMARRPPEDRERSESGEVGESIRAIENYSGKPDVNLQEAIKKLDADPVRATPGLVDCFSDAGRNRNGRLICSEVLQRNPSKLTPQHKERFLSIVRSEREHPLPRIEAAILLLKSAPPPSAAIKDEIKRMAIKIYKEGKHQSHIRMSVFGPYFIGDREVEDFLVDQLSEEPDLSRRSGILDRLAHMRCRRLVDLIEDDLESKSPGTLGMKNRLYLALGNLGGARAFEVLRKSFDKESDETLKNLILQAAGATKAPGAKEFLLTHLGSPHTHYIAAINGLKYLGDSSTIPILERELTEKGLNDYEKYWVRTAIAAIQSGNNAPNW